MYNGHLSIEQIESLSQQESQSAGQENPEDWFHVESCDHCRSLVEKCRIVDAKLGQLASARLRQESDMNCPDQKTWFEVAAGALPDEKSLRYLEHAATCDECGAKLKAAIGVFEEHPEDETLLDELSQRSKSPPFSQVKKSKPNGKLLLFQLWKSIAYSASGLAAIGLISWGSINIYQSHQIREAHRVLVAEYIQWRPTAYRLADLPYGPSRITRGNIQKRYIRIPENRGSPELRAAIALMRMDAEAAIQILEQASKGGIVSRSLLDDLVVAYATKAEITGSDKYYQDALHWADEVIQRYPDDSVAYFNRALINKNLNCPECEQKSRADFSRLVHLEKDPKWLKEIQASLE